MLRNTFVDRDKIHFFENFRHWHRFFFEFRQTQISNKHSKDSFNEWKKNGKIQHFRSFFSFYHISAFLNWTMGQFKQSIKKYASAQYLTKKGHSISSTNSASKVCDSVCHFFSIHQICTYFPFGKNCASKKWFSS